MSNKRAENSVSVGPGGNLDLDRVFARHPPTAAQAAVYAVVADMGQTFATVIAKVCPQGPERSLAITKVREAVMWANNSIAVSPKPPINHPSTVEEAEQALQVAIQSATEAEVEHVNAVAEAETLLKQLRESEEK